MLRDRREQDETTDDPTAQTKGVEDGTWSEQTAQPAPRCDHRAEAGDLSDRALIVLGEAHLDAHGIELDAATAQEQYRLFSVYSWISATSTYAMGSRLHPIEIGRRATERTTQAIIDLDILGLLADRLGPLS